MTMSFGSRSPRLQIGIMQGRLSPAQGGRIQSFPTDTWRNEFPIAQAAELCCIEWIYEAGTDRLNPLTTDEGSRQVLRASEDSGVGVWSICADYYMERHLIAPSGAPISQNVEHLTWLVGRAASIGARYVVLPFVDDSSLKTPSQIGGLARGLEEPIRAAERMGIELHLETDMEAAVLVPLLERLSSPAIKANYDIGNSASLGHDPREQLPALANWIGSVHVKDRLKHGSTVPLGTGDADFATCFRLILGAGFQGPFILQTARGTDTDQLALARSNRAFVESQIAALTASA
jgi:L-ribulose-5-phosphate 3-epimerase